MSSTIAKKPAGKAPANFNGAVEPRMTRAQWSDIVDALQFRSGMQSQDYALVQRYNSLANLLITRHLGGETTQTITSGESPPGKAMGQAAGQR